MKYMLILVGPEGEEQDQRSPEETQEAMSAWNDYTQALDAAGAYLSGEGLQPSATATTVHHTESGERIVKDGPFAETKEQVGGFYVLECANLDEALEWAKKVPIQPGNSAEVRPVMDFSEFGYEDPNEAKAAAS
jgi:hypothetical protein